MFEMGWVGRFGDDVELVFLCISSAIDAGQTRQR